MSRIWKLPSKIADDLKAFMTENKMTTNRFIIDLEKETIEEVTKDYSRRISHGEGSG